MTPATWLAVMSYRVLPWPLTKRDEPTYHSTFHRNKIPVFSDSCICDVRKCKLWDNHALSKFMWFARRLYERVALLALLYTYDISNEDFSSYSVSNLLFGRVETFSTHGDMRYTWRQEQAKDSTYSLYHQVNKSWICKSYNNCCKPSCFGSP